MKNNSFLQYFFLIFFSLLLVSCDQDYNELGANIVGEDNFLGDEDPYKVNAYTQALGPVETSNLPVQQLGIYNNPVFGKTSAHIAVQALLNVQPMTINYDRTPVIDSVILNVPYFSTTTETRTDATIRNLYELDSVYNMESKINLQVYESLFYQRAIDPETGETQKYYSDQLSLFEDQIGTVQLNDNVAANQNSEFKFSDRGEVVNNDLYVKVKAAPAMRLRLNTAFFTNKIMAQSASANLVNNNLFTNYFRGLHFKVSQSGSDPGALALLDIGNGTIKIYYTEYKTVPTAENPNPERDKKVLQLNLSGNSVNLFENEYKPTYNDVLNNPANIAEGDEKLYIKGGQGSMAVIELFKDTDELEDLRAAVRNNWLINDASLTFYIENSPDGMGYDESGKKAEEPNRVYLYDINNKRFLIDYQTDQTTSLNTKYNKKLLGGIIEKTDGRGTKYKIRMTNHIRRIIANDSVKNVRLGLVVTENINITSNKSLKTPKVLPVSGTFDPFTIKDTPQMSVANPFGTVLWGSNPSVPEDKRLKLTIYYTKPN